MKKIIFRKLLLDYMSFFLIALISAGIVIWVFQAVNFLDIMIEDGRSYSVYISYSLLNFPKIINKLFPFILFFSLFYVTIKYENNNELIIFWNFGINKIQLINFIFKFSVILMLIQLIFSAIIVPKSQDLARSFLRSSTVNFYENFIKPKRFNDTIKNVTIFSERKDIDGNLYNLYLKKEINENNFQITYAKKGYFKEFNNLPVLVLFNGETITSKNNEITNFSFSKSDFPINNTETNSFVTQQKTQELSSYNLLKCVKFLIPTKKNKLDPKIINCSERNKDNIFKELYKRFIIPIYILVLTLIPLLVTILSKEDSKYSRLKFIAFLIGLFFIIFSETTIRLISDSIIKNISISLLPFIFIITLYLIFLKKFNIKN
ncbi:LptF/LptG family permease [Pelagibacterales bacterium SAG-MED25]|uniref:LptF/LptG family permease n=1 Tax=Pelagibacter sp. (strain HTCC7211) TaxID=439493 RepID=UPI0002D34871|nr:LptF/LptG family permease [Candidatus Pelagibacter sp. HTCC7211]MBD1151084.1 LptF/LptG family permease [Pelagibacterales bacterium SAG-MED25]